MKAIQSSISSKHQTVVPAMVRKALKVSAGDTLVWRIIQIGDRTQAITERLPHDWSAYTYGLEKKVWKNLDINTYIQQLRQEWT